MITFVSLFLGLTLGLQSVQVAVADPDEVAAVEVYLDGRLVGTLEDEPWTLPCDFGEELRPHHLEAVALDWDLKEIGRVRQAVNLPRAPVEARVVFRGGEGGRGLQASLSWESLAGAEPSAVSASFDGRPLPVEDPKAIELPPHDPERLHFFRAELEFAGALHAAVESVLGGSFVGSSAGDLTAVVVRLEGGELPAVDRMRGWLLAGDEPLEVIAVERGRAEVVVVRDREAQAELARLKRPDRRTVATLSEPLRVQAAASGLEARTTRDWRLQFLWPVARREIGAARSYDLFSHSQRFSAEDADIFRLLTAVVAPSEPGPPRLADAVGVAGVTSAAGNHRRAVVLITAGGEDVSEISPAMARRFLERLQVPLLVWDPTEAGGSAGGAWGEVSDVSSHGKLEKAIRALQKELKRQRVVWLAGSHAAHEIELSPRAEGIRLAGSPGRQR